MKYGTSGFTEGAPLPTAEIRTHNPDGACTVGQLLGGAMVSSPGTAGANVTAEHVSADGYNYTTTLTLDEVAATIGDNASLAGGALIFTFPAGEIHVRAASIDAAMTLTTGTPKTDTPELGLGTTQGSGANATLGDVAATAENICGPVVAADINGTASVSSKLTDLLIATGGAHTVYFNYADGWANVDNTDATISGTVTIHWTKLA